MTTKSLSFKSLPQLAIAEGATAPNPIIAGVQVFSTTLNSVVFWNGTIWTMGAVADTSSNTFEFISKNIKSWSATLVYTNEYLSYVSYTDGVNTVVKTLNYTGGRLTSIILSGNTPSGIALTKTLSYTGSNITGQIYS